MGVEEIIICTRSIQNIIVCEDPVIHTRPYYFSQFFGACIVEGIEIALSEKENEII